MRSRHDRAHQYAAATRLTFLLAVNLDGARPQLVHGGGAAAIDFVDNLVARRLADVVPDGRARRSECLSETLTDCSTATPTLLRSPVATRWRGLTKSMMGRYVTAS